MKPWLIITVPAKDTRLVIGCAFPGRAMAEELRRMGYEVLEAEADTPPERSPEEKKRAAELVALLMTPHTVRPN